MTTSSFKPLPTSDSNLRLARFLSRHDDPLCRGFITRLDHSPIAVKRIAFFKALTLNTFILFALSALAAMMVSHFILSPSSTPIQTAVCVTHDFLVGSAIVVLLRSTIIPFFLGECRLRIVYGFRPSEIVIRRAPVLGKELSIERCWHMVAQAVNPALLYSNAGAMLSSDYWTLEYTAIFDALDKISEGEFSEEALEFAVWKQREQRWSVWELWKMHDLMTDQQEVTKFKSFLVRSGKEELLSVWQSIKSDDSAHDRSPANRSYQAAVDKFAQEGLDYETVWSQVSEKRKIV